MTKLADKLSKDALLERIGLEVRHSVRRSVLSSLGLVVLGAVGGAAVALLFAKKPGRELRSDLRARIPDRFLAHRSPNGESV